MVERGKLKISWIFVITLFTLCGVLTYKSALAASETQHASAWSVNNNADWTPFPPSANPLGVSDNNCTGASTPSGSWAEFIFPAFSIAGTATITGIQVKVKYRSGGSNTVQLTKSGMGLVGDARTLSALSAQAFCSSTAFVSVGVDGETWNAGLTQTDFNAGNVGIRLTQNANTVDIDAVELTVFYASDTDTGGKKLGEHFLCYSIDPHGDFKDREIKLEDQFGSSSAVVLMPVALCNPVDKNGEGILNRERHLVCYEIKHRGVPKQTVVTGNQFGRQKMSVVHPKTLCIPSNKKVIK